LRLGCIRVLSSAAFSPAKSPSRHPSVLVFPHKSRTGQRIQRFYSPRRKVVLTHRQSCIVHYWSNLNIKDTLARLRRNQDPAAGPTWEIPDDIDEDYLAQMEGEQRVKERGNWIWKQIGSPKTSCQHPCPSCSSPMGSSSERASQRQSRISRSARRMSCTTLSRIT
jgi:hypothetical protein